MTVRHDITVDISRRDSLLILRHPVNSYSPFRNLSASLATHFLRTQPQVFGRVQKARNKIYSTPNTLTTADLAFALFSHGDATNMHYASRSLYARITFSILYNASSYRSQITSTYSASVSLSNSSTTTVYFHFSSRENFDSQSGESRLHPAEILKPEATANSRRVCLPHGGWNMEKKV